MKPIQAVLVALTALVATGGCASSQEAGGSVIAATDEPHAVLTRDAGSKARGIYGVRFHRVGGDATASARNNIPVKPGTYTVRLSPDFSEMARNETTRLSGNRVPDFDELVREIELELEGGRRYFIGARYRGPTLYDWEPVVVRTERLTGRDGS